MAIDSRPRSASEDPTPGVAERLAYWRGSVRHCAIGAAGGCAFAYLLGGDFNILATTAGAVGALVADGRALEKHGPDRSKHPRSGLYRGANRLWHLGWRIVHRRRSPT